MMFFSINNNNHININFIYSVFHELICSLHVLANPVHHSHRLDWSQKLLSDMSVEMKQSLSYYNDTTSNWLDLLAFITEEAHWQESVTNTLHRLGTMEIQEFYHCFFSEKHDKSVIDKALKSIKTTPDLDKNSKELLSQPLIGRQKIIKFLSDYYYLYFAKDISFAEPLYIRKLEHQFNSTKDMDIYDFIHSLHPRIEVTEHKINFHKYKLFEVEKKTLKRILIFETSFSMPHLLVGFYPDFLTLTFPIYLSGSSNTGLPEDSLEVFKAIGDKTRLQIIKQLYNGPKTTQSLADTLNFTEAAISKQLKLLSKANLVLKERDGNYINYHLNIKTIDSIVYLLYEIIS